ncbi:hypothetical protein [Streptosporangium sandarakinum]|uniref:hypothetical protein n=1 Tax=Streptosporangium sandarakinum TaxID=1260955 RepID=UPI00371FB66F
MTGNKNTLIFGGLSRRQQRLIWSVLVLLVVLGCATILVLIRDDADKPKAVRTGAYTVSVRGSVVGGATFDQQGELRIRRSSDGLPYKWCLKVGNPWGAPAPGAIWFGTNGTCFGSGLDGPVVRLREDGGETVISPVTPPMGLEKNMNSFTATSGITASAYLPDRGEVRFHAATSSLAGTISLQGIDASGGTTRGVFTATLNASLTSDDPDALISSPVEPVPYDSSARTDVAENKAVGTRYSVKTLVFFKQLQGSPAFVDRARARAAGTIFIIDDRDGGDFVYAPPDARDDIFPVTGKATGTAPFFVLTGRRSSETLEAEAVVGGNVDLSGREPVMNLTVTTTVGISTATASATNATSYEFQAILQPINR